MFQVKICGVTDFDGAKLAVRAGADAVGFNFHPGSPRYVDGITQAAEIVASLPTSVARVGVFVNSSVEQIHAVAERIGLSHIQLHGDETVDFVASLNLPGVIKAFRCRAEDDEAVIRFVADCAARGRAMEAILIDAFVRGEYGGTGQTANWEMVGRLRDRISHVPIILAGGLHADNVARAIESARPAAVDTASGVESRPGVKDPDRTTAFVAAAKQALRKVAAPPTG